MKTLYTLGIVIFLNITGFSQSYEIRARYVSDNTIAVDVRITSGTPPTTSEFITDITFGIRWLKSYGVDLGNIIVPSPTYNVVKAGVEEVSGSFEYQAFSAALSTPFALPENWILDEWVELIEIAHNGAGSGTGTFEIAPSSGFEMNVVPNIGISLTDFTPTVNGSATNVPLPVELTQFTATATQKAIQLMWESASEQDFSGYEVERSTDSKAFQKIAWVTGKDNALEAASYTYKDTAVKTGIPYYYRLKMIDLNGAFEYSPIRTATLKGSNNWNVNIYPNPVRTTFTVSISSEVNENGTMYLYDIYGRLVHQMSIAIAAGTQQHTVQRSSLPAGVYYLQLQTSQNTYSQQIVLQ